mgnify:FL=1
MGNLFSSYSKGFPEDLNRVFIEHIEGSIITYRDLLDQSEKYANGFKALGLQAGDRVSIQVSKSPEVVFIYLACLRSNLIFHPLNTAYKEKELSFFLNDAKPSVFICEQEVSDKIASLDIDQLPSNIYTLLPNQKGTIHDIKVPGNHEVQDCPEEQIAALLYSSGTTGKPKGIMLSHGNIGSNAHALKEAWQFTSDDCLLHALPIYHVHGLFVALGCALLSGSKVLWLDTFNPDAVVNALPNCTVMMGVPTYYTRLLSNEKLNKEVVKNIRIFISGSAPLLEETFDEFYIRTGHEIIERYGMTETNIISSNPVNGERKSGTVGVCLKAQALRIVDEGQNILGLDDIGNIQVKGPNVFKGYWNLPEKTKEDFGTDNFFSTGDKGFLDAEGYLTIVGRAKDMIISGGLNVYPKEVESVINEIEGVIESAVIGLPDDDLGEKVVAVIVRKDQSQITESEVISSLKTQMAGFKVPKKIILIEELPRNAMGKVQKNILRDIYAKM